MSRGSLSGGLSVWEVSVWGSLSRGVSVWGPLFRGVSVQGASVLGTLSSGVSVWGSLSGGLCPEGLCQGDNPCTVLSQFSITFFTEMILLCEFNVYFELKCNT